MILWDIEETVIDLKSWIKVVHTGALYRDDEDVLSYSIVSGNSNNHFSINSSTGIIVLSNSLDFETSTEHTLLIRCTDSSDLFDEENVYVTVFPVNEFTPILTQINVTFVEQAGRGNSCH